jgi:hypothetical protein
MGSARITPRRVASSALTPRLPEAPAGATEHRAQHYMRLAAQRERERGAGGGVGGVWIGSGGGVMDGDDEDGDQVLFFSLSDQNVDEIESLGNGSGITVSTTIPEQHPDVPNT